jgi:hypothetical protein
LALVGLTGNESVHLAIFDAKGNFREEINRSLAGVLHEPPEEDFFDVNDVEFHAYLLREFGFQPELIRVKEFVTSEDLAVRLLPYFALVHDPEEEDEAQWGQDSADNEPLCLQGWLDDGDFVLTWGNGYHLDATGEVVGS